MTRPFAALLTFALLGHAHAGLPEARAALARQDYAAAVRALQGSGARPGTLPYYEEQLLLGRALLAPGWSGSDPARARTLLGWACGMAWEVTNAPSPEVRGAACVLLGRLEEARDNPSQAEAYYHDAAYTDNNQSAWARLAILELGRGASGDRRDMALNTLTRVATEGDPEAQTFLGQRLERGDDGPADPAAAATWYARAAAQNFAPAQAALGRLLLLGRGVARDLPRAAELIARSAAAGEPEGLYLKALQLEEGLGVPADPAAAARLYERLLGARALPRPPATRRRIWAGCWCRAWAQRPTASADCSCCVPGPAT
ncbi:hypothetical protein [Deinococcus multiflagellatus]|uniref:Sel1 repeat family protein n=1 Tax=Deinococcus multiflagellatus TaxID=1656887 RepID=A0ABW1ZJI8_9DEIO